MVSCRGTLACGVGSYSNIIIYLPVCRIGLFAGSLGGIVADLPHELKELHIRSTVRSGG